MDSNNFWKEVLATPNKVKAALVLSGIAIWIAGNWGIYSLIGIGEKRVCDTLKTENPPICGKQK